MKPSAIYQTCKQQLTSPDNRKLLINTLVSQILLAAAAAAIWFYGPDLVFQNGYPLATTGRRINLILAIYVIWLIKFLIIDLGFTNTKPNDPELNRLIDVLINRFRGAADFMKKTTITRGGKDISLQQLPSLIFLGDAGSGKTALLAHARAPYILQRHFTPSIPEHFEPSDNCDWWLTREGGLIDVPSKYLMGGKGLKKGWHHALWKNFLVQLKAHGGKRNIQGVAIALPINDLMADNNSERQAAVVKNLAIRIQSLEQAIQKRLPIHLVITKSDMIAGFNEFFAESSEDEITQAWGINIPSSPDIEETSQQFIRRFNALIKKLNEQLLWRLHHERSPIARPAIKDFPLQLEKVKTAIMNFIKQLNNPRVQGIYITSAMQVRPEPETIIIDNDVNYDQRAVQIFQDPAAKSRSYFIKQLITETLYPKQEIIIPIHQSRRLVHYAAYTASAVAIIAAAVLLGRDFNVGLKKTQQIQNHIVSYRNSLRQFQNPNESMMKTLALMESLQKTMQAEENKNIILRILNYYSDQSQKNAVVIYQHSLQTFLMPEIRNYFAEFLANPINEEPERIYRALKAYLMLGDADLFDAGFVRSTLLNIIPERFSGTPILLHHFDIAAEKFKPLQLSEKTITNSRRYLLSLRGIQLGYIILKSMDGNALNSDVLLSNNADESLLFSTKPDQDPISIMFTGRNFMTVFERQIQVAAHEAATGNWVLGTGFHISSNPTYSAELAEALRAEYVRNYANAWENAIENIRLQKPTDLQQADAMILSMTSYDSPLLKLLNTIHENTYFDPVSTSSVKLQAIGKLVDKSNPSKAELYQLFSNLQALHEYLQPVLTSEDPRKAAYDLIAERMRHQGELDAITKLRLSADQSPAPIKSWINQISNDTWHFLLKNAMRYMDTSWMERVVTPYQTQIANRYPFVSSAMEEVPLKKFVTFFGKPGAIVSYYNNFLTPFVDTSKPEWTWKNLNGEPLPFSPNVLHQIQQAMAIHHAFFPNDDDNVYVPFALQPYKVASNINHVKLNINNKVILDKPNTASNSPHVLAWPHDIDGRLTSIEIAQSGKKPALVEFPGTWGWFKLINESFVSMPSKREILLNFSKKSAPAEYLLSTQGKQNPFLALNLDRFTLDPQLTITTPQQRDDDDKINIIRI